MRNPIKFAFAAGLATILSAPAAAYAPSVAQLDARARAAITTLLIAFDPLAPGKIR